MKSLDILLCALALLPGTAVAQATTDVVIMRRSLAAPRPKATPTPAVVTCGSLTNKQYSADGVSATVAFSISSISVAQQRCSAYAATAGKGVCIWSTDTQYVYYQPLGSTSFLDNTAYYAATCQ